MEIGKTAMPRILARKVLCAIVAALVGLTLVSPSAAKSKASTSTSLRITTANDELAASQLYEWMKKQGYDVSRVGDSVRWHGEVMTLLLSPKVTRGGLDRIVVHTVFVMDPACKRGDVLTQKVAKLNRVFNIGSFSLDSDQDIWLTTFTTFSNTLDKRLLDDFGKWLRGSTLALFLQDSDLTRCVK